MEQSFYSARPLQYLGATCAATWRLVTFHPAVSVGIGVSVAIVAFVVRFSAGLPRWKGAPSVSGSDQGTVGRRILNSESSPGAVAPVCVSTITSYAAGKGEGVSLDVSSEITGSLRLAVNSVDATVSFLRVSEQFCSSSENSHCRRELSPVHDQVGPASVMSCVTEEVSLCGAVATCSIYQNFNGCLSNSSIDTPSVRFSNSTVCWGMAPSPRTDNKDSLKSDRVNLSHALELDKKFLDFQKSIGAVDGSSDPEREDDGGVSGALTRPIPCLLDCAPECGSYSSQSFEEEHTSRVCGHDGKRKLEETEHVSGIKSQGTFLHLVTADAVSTLTSLEANCAVKHEKGLQSSGLLPTLVSIEHSAAFSACPDSLESVSHSALETERVNFPVWNLTNLCASARINATHGDECNDGIEKQGLIARSPQLETQLKSLEARLQQQLLSSLRRLGVESSVTCCDKEGVKTSKISDTLFHASAMDSLKRGPDTSSLLSNRLAPETSGAVDTVDSSARHQHDRRMDDVFVRYRNDCTAPYSLSLTYVDAHGASRTVDAEKLPPLKLPPRPAAASDSSPMRKDASKSRRQSLRRSRPFEKARGLSSSCAASLDGATKVSKGGRLLVAPLPLLGPTTGPCSPKVVGGRGEYRIGAFLGGGGCGKVYECLNTETGEVHAVKEVVFDLEDKKLQTRLRQLKLEVGVLDLAARHSMPWIVGFYGAQKHGHSALMFLEYCSRGSLMDYMISRGTSPPTTAPPVGFTASMPAANPGVGRSSSLEFIGNDSLQEQEKKESKCGSGSGDAGAALPPLRASTSIPYAAAPTSQSSKKTCAEMPPLPIGEVQRCTRQIVEALDFLHIHGYAHLDVKTANVLVTEEGEMRLADFGCSMHLRRDASCTACKLWEQNANNPSGGDTTTPSHSDSAEVGDRMTEIRGTALYMAPEMIRFEIDRIDTAADIWSLGCVVMEIATGSAPWRHVSSDKCRILFSVASARVELPLPPNILDAAAEAERWLAREADDATIENSTQDSNRTARPAKRRCVEDATDETGAADGENVFEFRQAMALRVALRDFLSSCLRICPEERPSCEELLHHPFLCAD